MSDTRIENAIVEAILIIADKKIGQANFDKTIKAVIVGVLDQSTGKYLIKYQDSTFLAYATSSDVHYLEGQVVYVHIPANDWDKNKTILSGELLNGTVYKQVPVADDMYNSIGANGIEGSNSIEISSYHGTDDWTNLNLSFNNDIKSYIRQGDSISLGMTVQTKFAPSQQVNGQYGIRFILEFEDSETKLPVLRVFDLDSTQVIGNPYGLIKPTNVSSLITGIDTLHFLGIKSISAFCNGFAEGTDSQKNINDIIFSNIRINGAMALTKEELEGYSLHINCPNGFSLKDDIILLKLIAELKNGGKIINLGVTYYWFRLNAMTFRGSNNWNGYAGDGWECLNYKVNNDFVGKDYNDFYINGNSTDDLFNNKASIKQKINKILCVAVYGNSTFSKEIKLYNDVIEEDIQIISSDTLGKDANGQDINRLVYYLDNGSPTLTCNYTKETTGTLTYKWLVKPERGGAVQPSSDLNTYNSYTSAKKAYDLYITKKSLMAVASAKKYEENNKTIIEAWLNVKDKSFIYKNVYYNFPIKEIFNKTTISCSVSENNIYLGTGSITLYNKKLLLDMYSLQLTNGTQVFQYDGKGNSPASKQLDKPITIPKVSFSLFDDKGNEITHDQIRTNGLIKWIIPNTQTLLTSKLDKGQSGENDITVNSADLALPASSYTVYSSLDSFSYSIADRYDAKNTLNDIWLHIEFKDLVFDTYTDFTFPKDGDPGTNGTDYVAKIIPFGSTTDRLYLSNGNKEQNVLFDDDGNSINQIEFWMYNNSKRENKAATFWQVPPQGKGKTYLNLSKTSGENTKPTLQNISKELKDVDKTWYSLLGTSNYLPIDIIRAQQGSGNDTLKYYAEYPICVNFLLDIKSHYRFKIKPKTGFKYVVYASDGTSPNYDNTLPFEIIVEKFDDKYYSKGQENYTYNWKIIGNLSIKLKNGKYCTIEPKDTFDGLDLTSAVVCLVKLNNKSLGCLHVPIYIILNRYNNHALNDWDGNSIQIDKDKNGTILTPQIGAGTKDNDNAFTGILMGQISLNSTNADIGEDKDIGIMGYDSGVRTIFLDSKTGKAEFGKNKLGKIIIDPDATWPNTSKKKGKTAAFLYSNGFDKNKYLQQDGTSAKDNTYGSGMMIDLTSPAIQFGSGHFYVNSNGDIHAGGNGLIAGWTISDDKIFKHITPGNWAGMASQNWTIGNINGTLPNTTDTVAFYAGETHFTKTTDTEVKNRSYYIYNSNSKRYEKVDNPKEALLKNYYNHYNNRNNFYVTHNGYLFAKYGNIAGWNFNNKRLYNSTVGMGQNEEAITFLYDTNSKQNIAVGKARFWAGNKFIVDNSGKLYSNSAQIGPWTVTAEKLTNGNTGIGTHNITAANMNSAFGVNEAKNARIWSFGTNNQDNTINFVVTHNGQLYSKSGKIGGWTIGKNTLSGGHTVINSNGSLSNNGGGKGTWAIYNDGSSSFNNITASNIKFDTGTIKKADITYGSIGGITVTDESIYGDGFTITPTYSFFKGLHIDNAGAQSTSNGTSSIDTGAVQYYNSSGGGGGGYPRQTIDLHMQRIVAENIYATKGSGAGHFVSGEASFYNHISISDTGVVNPLGDLLLKLSGDSTVIASKFLDIEGKNPGRGLSATVKFNNDTYIKVSHGIVIAAKGVDNNSEITGYTN